MSVNLTESQNFLIGTIAAFIEGVLLQPTLYWKNAKAQNLPFTLDVRLLYRGTAASIFNECQMMGLQFGLTGFFQKVFKSGGPSDQVKLTRGQEFGGAACGGIFTAFFASPMELIMIQQQKNGGSFLKTPVNIISNYGIARRGMLRGLLGTMGRDCIYVCGMLGVTPIVQDYLMENHGVGAKTASFYASMLGGVAAAVPSHPFDCVKTCMQGDIKGEKYSSFSNTFKILWNEGGVKRMFNGCFWRTVNVTATVYVANECKNYLSPVVAKYSL